MKRRKFIALLGGATVAWPLVALSEQSERMRGISVVSAASVFWRERRSRLTNVLP